MFRSATTKIAHNTTLPALGVNKDLRPLQDLITAEKAIISSLVKLSADINRASDALRNWGLGEGEDLGDTLRASTKLLFPFASVLSRFATHEQAIRDHMKSVRTREENLSSLKHRRKNIAAKADSAEKKLQKMGPEHKNMQVQSDILIRLQDEIRELDSEIMTEEARLGDFKRSATQTWMALKFGALQECCEKGLIAADFGKLVITEIPQDVTQPGSARTFYVGHERTENYVSEALRSINDVAFDASLSSDRVRPRPAPPSNEYSRDGTGNLILSAAPRDEGSGADYHSVLAPPHPQYGHNTDNTSSNLQVDELGTLDSHSDVSRAQTYAAPPSLPASSPYASEVALSSPINRLGPGGQFATFPVKTGRQTTIAPSLSNSGVQGRTSFSDEMDEAFGQGAGKEAMAAKSSGDAPVSFDDPVPTYESLESPDREYPPSSSLPPGAAPPVASTGSTSSPVPPEGPPLGAAPPGMPQEGAYGGFNAGYDTQAQDADDDVSLPYMEPSRNERRVRFGSRPIEVRPISYLDSEASSPQIPTGREETFNPAAQAPGSPLAAHPAPQERVPTPPPAQEDDERALNAAAAREVSRELDALSFNPPYTIPPAPRSPAPPPPVDPRPATPLSIPPLATTPVGAPRPGDSPPRSTSAFKARRARSSTSPTLPKMRSPGAQTPPRLPSPGIPSIPSSPTQSALPPPPKISLPTANHSPSPSFSGGSPYRTPPEYPTNGGSSAPSPIISPSSSFGKATSSPPVRPPGARTISAAAFRRPLPQPRKMSDGSLTAPPPLGGGAADTSPLSVKKRGLPSSPYAHRMGSGYGGSSASLSGSQPPAPAPRLPSPPPVADDDQFDYISAYINADDPEPPRGQAGLR